MSESVRDMLAREAAEAEAVRDAEERGDQEPARGQRARRPAAHSSVYSLRLPTDSIMELRDVAERLGAAPTALLREWVLERLAAEAGRSENATQEPAATLLDSNVLVQIYDARRSITAALGALQMATDTLDDRVAAAHVPEYQPTSTPEVGEELVTVRLAWVEPMTDGLTMIEGEVVRASVWRGEMVMDADASPGPAGIYRLLSEEDAVTLDPHDPAPVFLHEEHEASLVRWVKPLTSDPEAMIAEDVRKAVFDLVEARIAEDDVFSASPVFTRAEEIDGAWHMVGRCVLVRPARVRPAEPNSPTRAAVDTTWSQTTAP